MSYIPLARKYRPKAFNEVIGQEVVTTILKNAFITNRLTHAYIFAGHKGVGKTTIARILAKLLNCLNPKEGEPCNACENCLSIDKGSFPDLIELDAASNRGIDEIRNLKEEALYVPIKGKQKVYIIDEAHMLTKEAFNALLKIIEEPPPKTTFILCTTEIDKIIPTIQSRCQKFHFERVSQENIIKYLESILKKENVPYEENALKTIALASDNSLRDAATLLDQAIVFGEGKVTESSLREMLGFGSLDDIINFLKALIKGDIHFCINVLENMNKKSQNLVLFWDNIHEELKNILLYKVGALSSSQEKHYEMFKDYSLEELLYLEEIINQGKVNLRTREPIFALELSVIKSLVLKDFVSLSELFSKKKLDLKDIREEKEEEKNQEDLLEQTNGLEESSNALYDPVIENILELFGGKIITYKPKS